MCVFDRVYLQFSLEHVHILSPSVAMVTYQRLMGKESVAEVKWREEEKEDGCGTACGKRKRVKEEEPDSSDSASSVTMTTPLPCVSMVIRVEQKEGVAWMNTGSCLKEEEAGLTSCFSVKATVIGPVVSWGRDPKNGPLTESETLTDKEHKVRNHVCWVCHSC